MKSNFFEVLRPGINSTFQDLGRKNFYHIGLPFSGAMDNRNYLLSNTLVNNKYEAAIEFAYQGPLLKYYGKSTVIAVTGDVNFSITKKNKKLINGECYKNYVLENEDELDIISTNKSVYGYLSVSGGFVLEKILNSYSTFSRAKIGPFKGEKLFVNQKILINKTSDFKTQKKIKVMYLENDVKSSRTSSSLNQEFRDRLRILRSISLTYERISGCFVSSAHSLSFSKRSFVIGGAVQ